MSRMKVRVREVQVGNTRLIDALRVADESVVAMNLKPMNSGNRREEKT